MTERRRRAKEPSPVDSSTSPAPPSLGAASVLALQRAAGNRATVAMLGGGAALQRRIAPGSGMPTSPFALADQLTVRLKQPVPLEVAREIVGNDTAYTTWEEVEAAARALLGPKPKVPAKTTPATPAPTTAVSGGEGSALPAPTRSALSSTPSGLSSTPGVMPSPAGTLPESEASSSPALPEWKRHALEQAELREKATADKAAQLAELARRANIELPPIPAPASAYRAAGDGQEPRDLLATGFVHRSGKATPSVIRTVLTKMWDPKNGGPRDVLQIYKASNRTSIGAPFISTGGLAGDAQGASSSKWSYAIALPGGVSEVPVTRELLGLGAEAPFAGGAASVGVHLFMNAATIDAASIVYLTLDGASLTEMTFLTSIPSEAITAFARLGGKEWQRSYRPYSSAVVAQYYSLLDEYKENA